MKLIPNLIAFTAALILVSCQNEVEKPVLATPAITPKPPTIAINTTCSIDDVAKFVGKDVKLVGTVKSTYFAEYAKGSPIFLNIDHPFPENKLTVVVFKEDADKLRFARTSYQNRRVQITGRVEQYVDEYGKVRPCIHIKKTKQLTII